MGLSFKYGGVGLLSVGFKFLGGFYFYVLTYYWSCIIVVTYSSHYFWYGQCLWDGSITDAKLFRPGLANDSLHPIFETELRKRKTYMTTITDYQQCK